MCVCVCVRTYMREYLPLICEYVCSLISMEDQTVEYLVVGLTLFCDCIWDLLLPAHFLPVGIRYIATLMRTLGISEYTRKVCFSY